LDALLAELKQVGESCVLVASLNLRGAAWDQVKQVLDAHYPDQGQSYQALAANRKPYHQALMERTYRIAQGRGLAWRAVQIATNG
jgi:hypothetical protein